MKIEVKRFESAEDKTLSEVFIDGEFFCYGLEDVVRESEINTVERIKEWKVYGKTAIPQGEYGMDIVWSNRFKRQMAYVKDVPGFSGILIHNGKDEKSTDGCLLVSHTKEFNYDRVAMLQIENRILAAKVAKENVTIEYTNNNQKQTDEMKRIN